MKTTLLSILTILFFFIFIPNSFAQNYNQWHLPEGATARLGKGEIRDIQYSPDGTRLAVGSSIGVWLYDAYTGEELNLFREHWHQASSVMFSPDGRTLASGDSNGIHLWNVGTGQRFFTIRDTWNVPVNGWTISFSPDGQTLASGARDGVIRLWDTNTGQHKQSFTGRTDGISSISFGPDGSMLATGNSNGTIHLWDAVTGGHKRTLTGHTDKVSSISFSPDGRTLATGSADKTVYLWDITTGQSKKMGPRHLRYVDRVSFSPDGLTLVSGGGQQINLWDTITGQHKREISMNSVYGADNVLFSPDGQTLASGGGGALHLWDTVTGQHKKEIIGHTSWIGVVSFSPDGKILASGGNGALHLWDTVTGQHKGKVTSHTVFSLQFSPDGQMLVSGSYQYLHLWDISTAIHQRLITFTGLKDWVTDTSFSPDGRILAASDRNGTIRLWGASTGQHKQMFMGHANRATSVLFSPDGQMLAEGTRDGKIHLWDISTGQLKKTLIENSGNLPVRTLSFSPNGQTLAAGGSNIYLWNVVSGVQTLTITGSVDDISFSPDGLMLAGGGITPDVYVWDTIRGTLLWTFMGHHTGVRSVSFSPDGRMLASGSYDGTVLVWDLTLPVQADMVVNISPSLVQSPAVGQRLVLSLNITDGQNVAGYQATVQFDASALQYISGLDGNFLPDGAFPVPLVISGDTVTLAATALDGESNGNGTLATLTFEVVAVKASTVTLSDVLLTNSTGRSSRPQVVAAKITGPPKQDEDVNSDGVVNIQDLVLVAAHFGQKEQSKTDVNADGVVNIIDLTLVAAALGNAAGAPSLHSSGLDILAAADVQQWLWTARQVPFTTPAYQRGILMLEQLLAMLTPKETALLANYPNPFNPETWIPYQLAEPANVTISIYSPDGKLVRVLELGHQPIGIYESRSRAAYWDGRNAVGEPVASGLYFYTLTTGDFTATRKMLMRK